MDCNSSFCDYISNCGDSLQINALLDPDTAYKYIITDKFSKEYEGEETTDDNGILVIDTTDLPDGLLNAFAGSFQLKLYRPDTNQPVLLKMAKYYDSIDFSVKSGTGTKASVGESYECTTGYYGL